MATFLRIWTMPFLLLAVGIVGLGCALVGDGPWDVISWVAMSTLVGIAGRYVIGGASSKRL